MKEFEDNYFELAIVDIPYGLKISSNVFSAKAGYTQWESKEWDNKPPEQEYFDELMRVSKNQVIWGANHFISKIPFDSKCWLIWDKGQRDFSLADAELAWTSFPKCTRVFNYARGKANAEKKIHQTQKPVQLYKWILKNLAKPTDRILDSHVGSGSSLIAFEDFGCEYIGYEIDKSQYEKTQERLQNHKIQLKLL